MAIENHMLTFLIQQGHVIMPPGRCVIMPPGRSLVLEGQNTHMSTFTLITGRNNKAHFQMDSVDVLGRLLDLTQ